MTGISEILGILAYKCRALVCKEKEKNNLLLCPKSPRKGTFMKVGGFMSLQVNKKDTYKIFLF